jgi:hypothetical protein
LQPTLLKIKKDVQIIKIKYEFNTVIKSASIQYPVSRFPYPDPASPSTFHHCRIPQFGAAAQQHYKASSLNASLSQMMSHLEKRHVASESFPRKDVLFR